MNGKDIKTAFRDTVPVLTGYVVLGMGFGILMHANGYGFLWSVAMSLFIYAGSMQYAAVGLLTGGATLITTALTTLAVNARHLFYGISMVDKYKGMGTVKPYLIFGLTDETYSLVCTGGKSKAYYTLVTLFDHIYWVGGTALGALLGQVIPFDTTGIDFALTALFLTIFTDQWLHSKRHFPAAAGVVISILCRVLFGASDFLIPSMIGIAAVLLIAMRREDKTDEN